MNYDLPNSLEVCGTSYAIRSDFRVALDICAVLNDPELSNQEKAEAVLTIFYTDFSDMPPGHYQEAIKKCFWFINGGEEAGNDRRPKLMDWEQDFRYIVAPVNRVIGREIRALPFLHWWTFLSAYYEIGGDCTFAQIVSIRDKLKRGKKLEKYEREWYQRNRRLVDMKQTYTEAEQNLLKQWGGE